MNERQNEALAALELIGRAVGITRHGTIPITVEKPIMELFREEFACIRKALSHAEDEAPFAWHRGGRAHEMLFADDLDGAPADLSDGWEPVFKHPAPRVTVPEGYALVPVHEYVVTSEDEDVISGIGSDLDVAREWLARAQDEQPDKVWDLVAVLDQSRLAAPAGEPNTGLLGALEILRGGVDAGNVDEAVEQCIEHLTACLGEDGGTA